MEVQSDNRYGDRIQVGLDRIMREHEVPGLAVGIVEDSKVTCAFGLGVMKIGEDKPITPETLFHMASVTKPFVATSIMQLVERGLLDLNAPVASYLPYFTLDDPRSASISVRHLVTHTSGMPDVEDYLWNQPEYDDGALERYVRSISDQTLLGDPGSEFRYSNMAFEVLGDLVAKVSGLSFEDYVEFHVLRPLSMFSSTLLLEKANQRLLATGHTKEQDNIVRPIKHYPYNRAHTPSSNLHSNVLDMTRWVMANLNGGELDGHHILENSTHQFMWRPKAEAGARGSVGISWFLDEEHAPRMVMHGGGDDGFLTYLVLVPSRQTGVVVMTNCDFAPRTEIWQQVLAIVLEPRDA